MTNASFNTITAETIFNYLNGSFWTREDEMIEDIECLDLTVEDSNNEYVAAVDSDENEYLIYLGHANTTMWVERVREM